MNQPGSGGSEPNWVISPNSEFLQAIAQGITGDAQALGGSRLISSRFSHGTLDHRSFPLIQIGIRREVGLGSLRQRLGRLGLSIGSDTQGRAQGEVLDIQ